MDGQESRGGLRAFLLGSAFGAVGALAAVRRSRPRREPRPGPAGLAAFEDAPCYHEIVEQGIAQELEGTQPVAASLVRGDR